MSPSSSDNTFTLFRASVRFGGEGGIRTHGTPYDAHTLSKRAPSATRTPLLAGIDFLKKRGTVKLAEKGGQVNLRGRDSAIPQPAQGRGQKGGNPKPWD